MRRASARRHALSVLLTEVVIMPSEDPLRILQAQIGSDERLEWSEQPGPIVPGRSEQQFALGIAGLSALIATTLIGVEGVAAGLGLLLPFALVFLVVWAGLTLFGRHSGRRPRARYHLMRMPCAKQWSARSQRFSSSRAVGHRVYSFTLIQWSDIHDNRARACRDRFFDHISL